MESTFADINLSAVASAIADPARARMLCVLLDGRARTATELAAVADIGASTASGHFQRLREQGLVDMAVQGKHRYYRLASGEVGHALEALLVVAGAERAPFKPNTPSALREARTCYDHMAGTLAVRIHDAMVARRWLEADGRDYLLTPLGEAALAQVGVDVAQARQRRRRFACACLDWSERRSHLGGALGAALLDALLRRGWITKDLDSRALGVTKKGERQFPAFFGKEDAPLAGLEAAGPRQARHAAA
ncbi:MAG: ArsR/SmtB family transcription factor [Achromobacter sp.]|uniref:ArsR/SmtB family transcription factor n=1 Tax=Achromobacter sp. TaxID=134375 RepID=UPI003D071860